MVNIEKVSNQTNVDNDDVREKIKNLITIIIPRHVDRANKLISEIEKFNLKIPNWKESLKKCIKEL